MQRLCREHTTVVERLNADKDAVADDMTGDGVPDLLAGGIGYDVHQFAKDRPLVLGGVTIPHDRGLAGHSDADVLSHAIADAVLGAVGEPDIGFWFPPSDTAIEGISSLKILEKAASLVAEHGGRIENIDATLVAESPRVMPHAPAMKDAISSALGIEPADVGIKATTNETMGFVGRGEGIAALAVASIALPER